MKEELAREEDPGREKFGLREVPEYGRQPPNDCLANLY